MKKVFLFLLTVLLSLSIQAKVGLLIPDSRSAAETAAAEWFTTASPAGFGADAADVLTLSNADMAKLSSYSTIWVMVDRSIDLAGFNSLFGTDQKNALTAFVKAGGNLLLCKQATRLVYTMDETNRRIGYAPEFAANRQEADARTSISTKMGPDSDISDKSGHYIYQNLEKTDVRRQFIQLCSSTAESDYRYCGWLEVYDRNNSKKNNNENRPAFESDWQATILAIRGGIGDYCFTDIVLFNQGTTGSNDAPDFSAWQGKILAIGSAAYQWTNNATYLDNVKTLTANAIEFLEPEPVIESDPSADMAYLKPASLSTEEANAAKWFQDEYIGTGKPGKFIDDLSDLTGIKVLWINIENTTTGTGDFSNDDATVLANFVKDGGHVLLTKKATYWAYKTERITCEPRFYNTGRDAQTTIVTKMGYALGETERYDQSDHALFKGFAKNGDGQNITLSSSTSDSYCGWIDYVNNSCQNASTDNQHKVRATNFESAWNAEAIAIEGGIGDYCYSNIIHFLGDEDTWHGSMLTIGATAYQWTTANTQIANVKALTANALNLLRNTEPVVKKVENPAAETAFLLMTTSDISTSADVTAAIAALPSAPERNAAKEFAKTYFAETEQESEGRYISLSELSRIPDSVKTIIIHADRTELFNWSSYTETLKTWVKERGGNLVLLRQATILASEMNRIDYAPYCQALSNDATGDNNPGSNQYDKIRVKMGIANISDCSSYDPCSVDRSGDDLFADMTIDEDVNNDEFDDKLITLNNGGPAKNRCYWQEILGNNAESATYSRVKFEEFQTRYHCEVLAVEGYVKDFCLASIIRFNRGTVPADSSKWKGSILAIGAGGFQYTDGNSANFGTMNTLVENAVESIKVSPCENCFRITFH